MCCKTNKNKNDQALFYIAEQEEKQDSQVERCLKETESDPIIAVALSSEEVNDVLRKIEEKIAEYEQDMNS